ncbi:MAG: GNAT family N-acetyltransferase [Pseudomonadota bacterium]
MTDEVHIRPAATNDVDALLDLYVHLSPDDARCAPELARESLERLALFPGSAILVGFYGDAMVVSCTLVVIPNLTRAGTPYALIENVVTDKGYRGRGFGTAILAAATGRAWAFGCYKVMLSTGSKRPETLAFYERAGFEQSRTGFQIRRIPARRETNGVQVP